jgi:hypothetical protein
MQANMSRRLPYAPRGTNLWFASLSLYSNTAPRVAGPTLRR